jgi:hypothetical protein
VGIYIGRPLQYLFFLYLINKNQPAITLIFDPSQGGGLFFVPISEL